MTILFFALAGFLNAVMDVLSFRFNSSIFKGLNDQWFNPNLSWVNKWKNGDPKQGERFFGSSTFFVYFSDCWHLAKGLMILCLGFGASLHAGPWWMGFVYFLSFSISFELCFSKVLVKK